MSATHHEPRTDAVERSSTTESSRSSRVRPLPPEPATPPVQFGWSFPVINFAGRLTSAQVVVTSSGLIVVRTPDGGSFAVDPDDQFSAFSAALRQARELALTTQERNLRTPKHREGVPRHG